MSQGSSKESEIVPGEVAAHTRMRLNRIDGQQVIRHQLNIVGLYGGFEKVIGRNNELMQGLMDKSESRLKGRREEMKRGLERNRKAREGRIREEAVAREKEREEAETERGNGSTLAGIGDLIQSDIKDYKHMLKPGEASPTSSNSSV